MYVPDNIRVRMRKQRIEILAPNGDAVNETLSTRSVHLYFDHPGELTVQVTFGRGASGEHTVTTTYDAAHVTLETTSD